MDWVQRLDAALASVCGSSSFNPCCRGLGSKTRATWPSASDFVCVSILVVVDWVQRPVAATYDRTRKFSFNPCCRGLGSKTFVARPSATMISEFQSLLSWIGFKDWQGDGWAEWSPRGFNPCCRGLGSKTRIFLVCQRVLTTVSILVVVDWVQRLHSPKKQAFRRPRVSILVVVDWVQRHEPSGFKPVKNSSFNPCCRGLGSKTSTGC